MSTVPGLWRAPPWRRAFAVVGGIHGLALGALFVHLSWPVSPSPELPAIAVDMAPPEAVPASIHDVPTPQQIEAPKQTLQKQPEQKKLPFDPPPQSMPNVKAEVVLPPKKEAPPPEKVSPLPPAPTTTEAAAPDLKPSTRAAALLTGGAAAGKSSPDALWDARIRARIELTKRYPGAAARLDQQDDVDVLLTIDREGRLLDARIRNSRGFSLLNDAALEAVRRSAPFPKPPKEILGDPIRLSVIVQFFKQSR